MHDDAQAQTVSVLGLAESGRAAARLALEHGARVYVSDLRTDAQAHARADELRALGADVELGGHDLDRLAASDAVVVSPGIPPNAPVLVGLRERGVRWISEPEFAFRFLDGALIAVTGTNGKTTTAAMTAHLMKEGGASVALGGNIGSAFGPPMSDIVRRGGAAWYVVELSSFQLADIDVLRPDIGIVTSLAPDHLDRYESVEAYYADKARLFENADDDSRWVLPAGNAEVEKLAGDAPGRRYTFGAEADADATVEDGRMVLRTDSGAEVLARTDELPLLGSHNVENALAAAMGAWLAGITRDALAEALTTAPPLPHRMERVDELAGIVWVNDSKATNVAAALAAIESLRGPLIVLLGGKDKGEDVQPLGSALAHKAHTIIAFGEARDRIAAALGPDLHVERALTMERAMELAAAQARSGDTVLLSPACSSFDAFTSYEHRGRAFRDWVEARGGAGAD